MLPPDPLPPDIVEQLRSAGHVCQYGDEQIIHEPAAPSWSLFEVHSGRVKFSNFTEDGREVELLEYGPGHWFGDVSLFSGRAPPHVATAIGATALCVVPEKNALNLISKTPDVALALMKFLAQQLHATHSALDKVRSQSADEQVWTYLVWLAHQQGVTDSVDGLRRIPISQQKLADRLGMSRLTIGRVLKKLCAQHKIELGYGWIEVAV